MGQHDKPIHYGGDGNIIKSCPTHNSCTSSIKSNKALSIRQQFSCSCIFVLLLEYASQRIISISSRAALHVQCPGALQHAYRCRQHDGQRAAQEISLRDQLARQKALLGSSIHLPDGGRRLAMRIQQLEAELTALATPQRPTHPSQPAQPVGILSTSLHGSTGARHDPRLSSFQDSDRIDLTGARQQSHSAANLASRAPSATDARAPINRPMPPQNASNHTSLSARPMGIMSRLQISEAPATPIIDMTSAPSHAPALPDTVPQQRYPSGMSMVSSDPSREQPGAAASGAIDLTEESPMEQAQAVQRRPRADGPPLAAGLSARAHHKHAGQDDYNRTGPGAFGLNDPGDRLAEQLQEQLSIASRPTLRDQQALRSSDPDPTKDAAVLQRSGASIQPGPSQSISTGIQAKHGMHLPASRSQSASESAASLAQPMASDSHPIPAHACEQAQGLSRRSAQIGASEGEETKLPMHAAHSHAPSLQPRQQPLSSIINQPDVHGSRMGKQALPQKLQQSSHQRLGHNPTSSMASAMQRPAHEEPQIPAQASHPPASMPSLGPGRDLGKQASQQGHRAEAAGHANTARLPSTAPHEEKQIKAARGVAGRAEMEAEVALLKHKLHKYCAILADESKRAQLPDGGLQVRLPS